MNTVENAKSKYDEASVVKQLNLKQDLKINPNNKTIVRHVGPSSKGDVGNKSKGKMTFLSKVHHYTYVPVTEAKEFQNY